MCVLPRNKIFNASYKYSVRWQKWRVSPNFWEKAYNSVNLKDESSNFNQK